MAKKVYRSLESKARNVAKQRERRELKTNIKRLHDLTAKVAEALKRDRILRDRYLLSTLNYKDNHTFTINLKCSCGNTDRVVTFLPPLMGEDFYCSRLRPAADATVYLKMRDQIEQTCTSKTGERTHPLKKFEDAMERLEARERVGDYMNLALEHPFQDPVSYVGKARTQAGCDGKLLARRKTYLKTLRSILTCEDCFTKRFPRALPGSLRWDWWSDEEVVNLKCPKCGFPGDVWAVDELQEWQAEGLLDVCVPCGAEGRLRFEVRQEFSVDGLYLRQYVVVTCSTCSWCRQVDSSFEAPIACPVCSLERLRSSAVQFSHLIPGTLAFEDSGRHLFGKVLCKKCKKERSARVAYRGDSISDVPKICLVCQKRRRGPRKMKP